MKSRISYWLIIFMLLSLFYSTAGFSDQIAVTEDGKKVLLKDDGTWEYVKQRPEKAAEFIFYGGGVTDYQANKSITIKVPDGNILIFTITERTEIGECPIVKVEGFLPPYVYLVSRNNNALLIQKSCKGTTLQQLEGFPERAKKKVEDIKKQAISKKAREGGSIFDEAYRIAVFAFWENPTAETKLFKDFFWWQIKQLEK